jgi:C-5 cytosine-specific DNA methylase
MSSAQTSRGSGSDPEVGSRDHRNLLVSVIADAVEELRPRAAVVENVPAFLTRAVRDPRSGTAVSAARLLVERLSAKYVAYPLLADLADFGVPQTRRRTFLTFLRRGERPIRLLDERATAPYARPTHSADYGSEPVTVRDVLAEAGMEPLDASSPERARSANEPMHYVPVWDAERYAMVAAIPPGEWRHGVGDGQVFRLWRSHARCRRGNMPSLRGSVAPPTGLGETGHPPHYWLPLVELREDASRQTCMHNHIRKRPCWQRQHDPSVGEPRPQPRRVLDASNPAARLQMGRRPGEVGASSRRPTASTRSTAIWA